MMEGTVCVKREDAFEVESVKWKVESGKTESGKTMTRILIFLFLSSLIFFTADACTTFFLHEAGLALFGRNYDWVTGEGMLMVNKRGMMKTSITAAPNRPATWESRFGSVTFNQYGREFPTGGMNEAGLIVELLWLEETKYPDAGQKPAVGILEWIQYQLDRASSVAEVLQYANEIRIASRIPLHFLVADRNGRAATVEYLDGKLVAHTGATLPVPVLANSTYESSLQHFKQGTSRENGPAYSSLDRFATAATMIKNFREKRVKNPTGYAFEILRNVSQPNTQWSIVYDLRNRTIHFFTKQNREIKRVRFEELNFECGQPVVVADLNQPYPDPDISRTFVRYTSDINVNLIRTSYEQTDFLAGTAAEAIQKTATHPDSFICQQKK